jgi:hypothetical protein
MSELVDLALEPANGESRLLLLPAIARSRSPIATRALTELRLGPVFAKEFKAWDKGAPSGNGSDVRGRIPVSSDRAAQPLLTVSRPQGFDNRPTGKPSFNEENQRVIEEVGGLI